MRGSLGPCGLLRSRGRACAKRSTDWDAATGVGGVAPIGREHKPNGQNPVGPIFAPRGAVAPSVAFRLGSGLLAAGPALNPHYSYGIVGDSRERRPRPAPVTTEVFRWPWSRTCLRVVCRPLGRGPRVSTP